MGGWREQGVERSQVQPEEVPSLIHSVLEAVAVLEGAANVSCVLPVAIF